MDSFSCGKTMAQGYRQISGPVLRPRVREKYRARFLPDTEILSITGITIQENGTPSKGARFGIHVPKGDNGFNRYHASGQKR